MWKQKAALKGRRRIPVILLASILIGLGSSRAGPAYAFCIWGFGQCAKPGHSLSPGDYMQDGDARAVLTITPDKITSKSGPVSFSVDYNIKSVDGKNVTIEISPPEPKEILRIQVEKDLLKIRGNQHFSGDWKKK